MDISIKNYRDFLSERYKNSGMFHATILSGPQSEEKDRVIRAIAASIVCQSTGSVRPCMNCEGCRKAFENIHPDITVIDLLKDKKELTVDQMRVVRSDAFVVPNDGENRVYIINNADKMNTAAQNVLLKTLEEPPRFSYFILCAENPSLLLPTVRSRCALIRFISGQSAAAEEDVENTADRLIDTYLSGDRFSMVSFINSLEKTDRITFGNLSSAVSKKTVSRLKTAEDPNIRKKLLKMFQTFDTVSSYLSLNVGVVHILGLLCAELT